TSPTPAGTPFPSTTLFRSLTAAVAVALSVCAQARPASLTHREASLLSVMNEVRASNGLRPLRVDVRLEGAARRHSTRMLQVQSLDRKSTRLNSSHDQISYA